MKRTNRFLGSLGFGYATQALIMLVGLWLTPFLLRHIGQRDVGLWMVGIQIMFYMSLLDLGVIALLPRETAYVAGRAENLEQSTELSLLVGQTARLVLWQTPFIALGAVIAWLLMPAEWEPLRYPIGLILLVFVATYPLRIFGAVLQGLQDLIFLGKLGIISYLISTALTICLVLAGLGLSALAIGWASLQVISSGAAWYRLRARFPFAMPDSWPELLWTVARGRLRQGFWISINQVAQVLLSGTDILIIGKMFGPAAVVPYVCTGKLISVLMNQPNILITAAVPALSQMRYTESRERISQVCTALGQAMMLLSGAIFFVVLMINQGFVSRWVGAHLYGGLGLTMLLLLSMLARHWNVTIGAVLFCFGYERRLALTALLDGVVTVCLVATFVYFYGLIGAPLGTVVSACVISLPINLRALAGETKLSLRELLRPLAPWFIRFSILVGVGLWLLRMWTPSSLLLIGVTACVAALVYLGLMFSLTLRSPLGIYVRPRLLPLSDKLFRAFRSINPT